jgi:oligoendopeptidase F
MALHTFQPCIDRENPSLIFIPADARASDAAFVSSWFRQLLDRPVASAEETRRWLEDSSELAAWLEEDLAWRYIKMTCNTQDKEASEAYSFFIEEIDPEVSRLTNELNKRLVALPGFESLDFKGADILRKNIQKDLEIFREENIPLNTEIQTKAQEFASISGAMSVEWKGEELPMPRAASILQSTDREERKSMYEKIQGRRHADAGKLQQLYSELVSLRHKVAQNAGFADFRDYSFKAMGRFDYTPQDCLDFHASVEAAVVPLLKEQMEERRRNLGLETLKPYDLAVQENGLPPLKAFSDGKDLLDKGIEVFSRLDPFLGNCLKAMEARGHFDLESRKGKAPGGYNYPLDQTGFPFIFMNASDTLRDMVTLMHEGGHAVHSIVTRFLPLSFFKHTSSEVAELASMSMELMSMDHWDVYFPDAADLKRAKKEHLAQVMDTLPWVATIDAFQHWVYVNPMHTAEERTRAWLEISGRFSSGMVDYAGYEHFREVAWQKQLHLFEVPFYYIEYGMAQLGAIAVWKNYRENPEKALESYLNALALGHTAGIREVYETAGIRFDFSGDNIRSLMDFVREEMERL